MKQVKNIVAVSAVALSMAFAGGLSVSTNVNWTDLDGEALGASGQTVLFGFNDNTSLGFDSQYGMLAVFNVAAGANLRLGWSAGHTIGIGYTFWSSSGDGVKTSLSTSLNYTKTPDDNTDIDNPIVTPDNTSLSMSLGFTL
jgi:hypothetical protein